MIKCNSVILIHSEIIKDKWFPVGLVWRNPGKVFPFRNGLTGNLGCLRSGCLNKDCCIILIMPLKNTFDNEDFKIIQCLWLHSAGQPVKGILHEDLKIVKYSDLQRNFMWKSD